MWFGLIQEVMGFFETRRGRACGRATSFALPLAQDTGQTPLGRPSVSVVVILG